MSVTYKTGSTTHYGETFIFSGPDGTYRASRAVGAFDLWWASGLPIDAWLEYASWADSQPTRAGGKAVAR